VTATKMAQFLFAGATEVNYEPPTSTSLVLSVHSLVGCSYET